MSYFATVRISDGTTVVDVDAHTRSLNTIPAPRQEVHDGTAFRAEHIFTAVGNGNSVDFLIAVGSNKILHATLVIITDGKATATLYEDGNITGGTAVTGINLNRVSGNTTDATFAHTPTVTTTGASIGPEMIPAGTKNRFTGGVTREGLEWMLDKSTNYLVRATNNSGANSDIQVIIEYTEE